MLPLGADENLNNDIIRGVLRVNPKIDIARLRDAGSARCRRPGSAGVGRGRVPSAGCS